MQPIKINLTYLKSVGACEEGLRDFRAAFPRGLTVKPGARLTKCTAERLMMLAHYIDWFVEESSYISAETAVDVYEAHVLPARGAYYDFASTKARTEYNRARVVALWLALGGGAA